MAILLFLFFVVFFLPPRWRYCSCVGFFLFFVFVCFLVSFLGSERHAQDQLVNKYVLKSNPAFPHSHICAFWLSVIPACLGREGKEEERNKALFLTLSIKQIFTEHP